MLWAMGATAGANVSGRIAWSRDGDIFTMRPDGSHKRQVTSTDRTETAVWSPDGTKLALIRYPAVADQRTAVMVVNADGSGVRRLARARFTVQELRWAPDGTKLAFCDVDISQPDLPTSQYPSAIKVIDLNMHTVSRLTAFDEHARSPTWSPGSDRIAFAMADLSDSDVWVMNADGTARAAVTVDNKIDQLSPVWSPNADRIAYERVIPKLGKNAGDAAVVLEVRGSDGGNLVQLTAPTSSFDEAPQWAPDGGGLLFFRLETVNYTTELRTVTANGSSERGLTMVEGPELSPVWAPDASAITFGSGGDIYVIHADGSGRTKVAGKGARFDVAPTWGSS
jgi:Tol biopolymer transport system component